MQISQSVAKKLLISDIENLDPIAVFLEDFGIGRGKITITCFGDAWSAYWGAMGKLDITHFFLKGSEDYLARKLKIGIKDSVLDVDAVETHAKAHICVSRKNREIGRTEARHLFGEAGFIDDPFSKPDLMYEIYGDEWWDLLPKKENPDWTYLCSIIRTIKLALANELTATA